MAVTKITTTNLTIIEKVTQIFIGTYFATLDRVKKRREYLKTIRELEKMSNRDLADIGFSRAEIKARALKSIYKINIWDHIEFQLTKQKDLNQQLHPTS